MKRAMGIVLVLAVLFTLTVPANLVSASNGDFTIKDIAVNMNIEKGDTFQLTFTVENNTDEELESFTILLDDNDSFKLQSTDNISMGNIGPHSEVDLDDSTAIRLRYVGSGRTYQFSVHYVKGGTGIYEKVSINIPNIIERNDDGGSRNPGSGNADLAPNIGISESAKMPVLKAGTINTLTFPIKNMSRHAARDVEVTLNLGETTNMFRIDDISLNKYLGNMDGQDEAEANFTLFVYSNAKSGVYPITLHYKFKNVYGVTQEYNQVVNIKITNTSTPPSLELSKTELKPEVLVPGREAKLTLYILNSGSLSAENIKINLQGLSSSGVALKNATDTAYIRYIFDHGIEKLEYDLVVSENLTSSIYEMSVFLEYMDANNVKYSDSYKFYLPVDTSQLGKPSINIENLSVPQGKIEKGEDFRISFDLVNNGSEAKNMKVYITEGSGVITKSLSPVIIDKFARGRTQRIEFIMSLTEASGRESIPLPINIEYEELSGRSQMLKKVVDIKVAKGSGEESVPKIIISNYGFEPEEVVAGENFTLKMTFLNTHKAIPVSNIKISLSSPDGVFTPAFSSNTFYIEEILPGETAEREIVLYSKSDATPKSYTLNVDFEYEGGELASDSRDETGSQHIAKETISIPVIQVPRLVTGDIQIQPSTFIDQSVPVFVEFYNMGKSTLYNLMVKTEGDFQTQEGSYFVGNFEPGRSDYYESIIIPTTEGQIKGVIAFYFEDERGIETKIEKEFTLEVMAMPRYDDKFPEGFPMDPDGMPMEENAGKGRLFLFIGIGAGVLIAAGIVVFIILRRRHIRKAGLTLDD